MFLAGAISGGGDLWGSLSTAVDKLPQRSIFPAIRNIIEKVTDEKVTDIRRLSGMREKPIL